MNFLAWVIVQEKPAQKGTSHTLTKYRVQALALRQVLCMCYSSFELLGGKGNLVFKSNILTFKFASLNPFGMLRSCYYIFESRRVSVILLVALFDVNFSILLQRVNKNCLNKTSGVATEGRGNVSPFNMISSPYSLSVPSH